MTQDKLTLLKAGPELPEGFKYRPEIISADDERGLLERISELRLKEFEFHGFTAKRRVVSYGWSTTSRSGRSERRTTFRPGSCRCARWSLDLRASPPTSCSRRW